MLETADSILAEIYPLIIALAVAASRSLGMVIVTPAFTRLGLTGLIRSAVAVAVALPMLRPVYEVMAAGGAPTTFELGAIVAKEVLVGTIIGTVFGVPFWAADAAGELVDLQRGSTMAQLLDPQSVGESSITSTLFSVAIVTLFFMIGGFTGLLGALYRSYEVWPVRGFAPLFGAGTALFVLGLLDQIMRVGVLMIAPIVLALLIADIMLAYLSRMSPQLHVFDLSLAVKNLVFSFLIVLYIAFLTPLLLDQLDALGSAANLLQTFGRGEPSGAAQP